MFTKDNAAKHGSKGGRVTVERHGAKHMRRIGRKGFESTTERHFGGCEDAHKYFLGRLCRWNYWKQSGLPMRYDRDGRAIWLKPDHPAHKVPF